MKTITIPARDTTVLGLLKRARRGGIILKSPEGEHFVLSSVAGWQSFEIGADLTQNKDLMKYLSARRGRGKRIPLAAVKAELGLR